MGQIIEVLEILVERGRRASHFKGDKDMTNQSVLMQGGGGGVRIQGTNRMVTNLLFGILFG